MKIISSVVVLLTSLALYSCQAKCTKFGKYYMELDPIICVDECIDALTRRNSGMFSKVQVSNEAVLLCKEKGKKYKCYGNGVGYHDRHYWEYEMDDYMLSLTKCVSREK